MCNIFGDGYMNVLELLDNELKDKHFNDFEKVRYIYLRTCQFFYFDGRYHFAKNTDIELLKEICNKKLDVTNINDFSVTCHSYSEYILFTLIRELTGANVSLKKGSHSFVVYEEKPGITWNMDATYGDLSRVKIDIRTKGFVNSSIWYKKRLEEVDKVLGYNHKSKNDFLKYLDLNTFECLMNSINSLLEKQNFVDFTDALFFVKWILLGTIYPFSDTCGMDQNYRFYNFFFDQDWEKLFCLSNGQNGFMLDKISRDDCVQLTKKLHILDDSVLKNL